MSDEATAVKPKPKAPSHKTTIEDREEFVAASPRVKLRYVGPDPDGYHGFDLDATPIVAAQGEVFECSNVLATKLLRDSKVGVRHGGTDNPPITMVELFEKVK